DISSVPSIAKGNSQSHAIGLGQMNLHGYLAREHVHYGSEEGIDFTNMYFYTVLFMHYAHQIRSLSNARNTSADLKIPNMPLVNFSTNTLIKNGSQLPRK